MTSKGRRMPLFNALKLIFLERGERTPLLPPSQPGYDEAFFELLYKSLKLLLHRSPGHAEGYVEIGRFPSVLRI